MSKVTEDVKAEFRDDSAAVQSHGVVGGASFTSTEVKTAVRTALSKQADEEGRETNLVIFGIEGGSGGEAGGESKRTFQ